MPRHRNVLLLGLGLVLLLAVIPGQAIAKQSVELPDYEDRLSMWPDAPEVQYMEIDTPFYAIHSWGDVTDKYPRNRYTIRLFMDGAELAPTFVGCVEGIGEPAPRTHCRDHLWDFSDGIAEPGEHELVAMWMAPCGAMAANG
ncbi:MAG: hypothetical protein ACR2N7_06290, partial [Acidimicrobiia bacterium]